LFGGRSPFSGTYRNYEIFLEFAVKPPTFLIKKWAKIEIGRNGGSDMRISQSQARILACVELDARRSSSLVAKQAGVKHSTIGYCLRTLEAKGVIRRTAILNLQLDGYSSVGIFFSLASQHGKNPQRLITYLLEQPEVVWAAEYGGDFQYGLALCVRSLFEVHSFLERLAEKHPALLFEKSIVHQNSLLISGHGFLASAKYRGRPIQISPTPERYPLDELDRKILKEITRSSFESRRQVSAALKVPSQTVDLRIKKLESAGVIVGYVYELDTSQFGTHAHKLLLYCKGVASELRARVFEYASRHPAVTHCYECLGAWDYELNVEVEDPRTVTSITQEIYQHFGNDINTIKTLIRYRQLKSNQVPF
jgi:DNA-binding Lrp family transcriptional regulator